MNKWGILLSTAHCVVWQLALYKIIYIYQTQREKGTKNCMIKLPQDNGVPALRASIQMLKDGSQPISFFGVVANLHCHWQ